MILCKAKPAWMNGLKMYTSLPLLIECKNVNVHTQCFTMFVINALDWPDLPLSIM